MKTTINAASLAEHLDTAARIILARTTLPILCAVRFTIKTGGYTLESSNLEQWLRCEVEHSGDNKRGVACVPAKTFASVLHSFGKSDVEITCNGKALEVRQGKSSAKIPVYENAEWPDLKETEMQSIAEYDDHAKFHSDLMWCGRAVSKDATRWIMNGVYVNCPESVLLSSDGRRCHRARVDGLESLQEFVIPTPAIAHLGGILGLSKASTWEYGGGFLSVKAGEWAFMTKLIEGTYPYVAAKGFFGGGARPKLKMNVAETLDAIKSMIPFLGQGTESMKVTAEPMGAMISVQGTMGKADRFVSGGGSVAPFAASPRFFADMIVDAGEEIEVQMMDEKSPLLIETGNRSSVMMPMCIQK